MPYGGGIISHNTSTNDWLGSNICTRWPRGSPGVIRLVWGCFGVFALINSKYGICMRKESCLHALYQRQPVLRVPNTATDLVVYEWGAQVRKYKISKNPYLKKRSSSKRSTIVPSYTTKSQKDISTLYSTILQYSKDPQYLQDHTTKTLLDQQDPHRLLFILECNYDRRPQMLPEISRRV
jgi:hypothetical protein